MLSIMLHQVQLDHDHRKEAMTRLSAVIQILVFDTNRYIASSGYLVFEMLLKNDSTKHMLG